MIYWMDDVTMNNLNIRATLSCLCFIIFLFLPHVDIICNLQLNRPAGASNLFYLDLIQYLKSLDFIQSLSRGLGCFVMQDVAFPSYLVNYKGENHLSELGAFYLCPIYHSWWLVKPAVLYLHKLSKHPRRSGIKNINLLLLFKVILYHLYFPQILVVDSCLF